MAALARVAIAVRPTVIITIAVTTALVIPITPMVVVLLDAMGARASTDRQHVVIITVALVPVSVSRISLVPVVTRIEVHE